MDIAIQKRPALRIRPYLLGLGLVLVVSVAARYWWLLGQADYAVAADSIVFSKVQRGNFHVSVRGSGILSPEHIRWLSANVDAKVEQLIVKAGHQVKQGDLIAILSNPRLERQLEEASWELTALQADIKAGQVAQESAVLAQRARLLNAKLDYDSSLLKYNAETKLLKQSSGAISQLTYERTKLETEQFRQRLQISEQELLKMQDNLIAQAAARQARLEKARKAHEQLQQQVDSLQVRASMDSIVLEVPLEPGKRILMGENLAKLAQHNSLIAELQVPEIQIKAVTPGQKVTIDTRNSTIQGQVIRVDPAVTGGKVQVDVALSGPMPDDARPALSVDGEIHISNIADTLFVDRPLYAQSQSQTTLYKLSQDRNFAELVPVSLGQGSINQIQILDGLQAGDLVVTSDPSRFSGYPKFRIN
ncbi:efflux RND transporter periplasmic adaptor subunit [Bowmanella denitrificans]|uniref:Efflux RND transporter periplasmic adaptor subunit n=1 Tax=Bowmanella denitrificans TaxID=366582 RepID=A0ABN0XGW9_9ALTE